MALEIELFSCLKDNLGVLLHDPASGATVSIDAPEETAIIAAAERRGWTLTDIFTTHHHADHVGANLDLKLRYDVTITGPENERDRIPGIDRTIGDGGRFDFAGHTVEVIETPGHTAGHICYHFVEEHLLFAADTLFALGCGRLFERGPQDMWISLTKLSALPDETVIYFGHEYTLSNARFALTIDPENRQLAERAKDIERLRAEGKFTAPTRFDIEKATNPFLRAGDPAIRRHLGMENAADWEVLGEIRRRKDQF